MKTLRATRTSVKSTGDGEQAPSTGTRKKCEEPRAVRFSVGFTDRRQALRENDTRPHPARTHDIDERIAETN